jgi:hypothetical protein
MAYGIDSTIQDKVNAFRGQPQQLMQQYGQSQQLVDLLALQQIKSEKEAAARQIQMAMAQKQGQPTTIAQQREQEVMGLTRDEIAKQIKQGMPQQPQAPQQAPQQGGGISALPAPNMQGMAGGGIVAFAGTEGSEVPDPEDAKVPHVYDKYGNDITFTPEQVEKRNAALRTTQGEMARRNVGLRSLLPQSAEQVNKAAAQKELEATLKLHPERAAALQAAPTTFTDPADYVSNMLATSPQPPATTAPPATTPPSGDYLSNMGATKAPPAAAPQGIATLATDKTAAAPAVDIDAITKRVGSGYNMDEINKQRADIAAQIAKMNAEQNDPSTQNRDRLAAFLSAAGAGTSLASGARLGGAAVTELNATRQAARAAQLKDLQTTADSRAKELMEGGMKRTDAIERAIAEANQTAATIRGQDVQATSAANQTAAFTANSIRDLQAAEDRIKAVDLKTEEDYRKAEKLLAAKNLADQSLSPEARSKVLADFDANLADSVRTKKKQEIASTKGKNAAEAATTEIEAYVALMRQQYLMQRVGVVQQSYGTPASTPTPSAIPNDPMAKFYR